MSNAVLVDLKIAPRINEIFYVDAPLDFRPDPENAPIHNPANRLITFGRDKPRLIINRFDNSLETHNFLVLGWGWFRLGFRGIAGLYLRGHVCGSRRKLPNLFVLNVQP